LPTERKQVGYERSSNSNPRGFMEIKYSERAVKQIKQIHKGDRKSARMIMDTLEAYAQNPDGTFDVKVLKGKYGEFKRLRVGKYRIIFDEDGNVMFIYEVKHRQEAYHG
jgi:mRNA interferase RelE/StbE